MNQQSRWLLIIAGLFGAASVALAAIGAHGIHQRLLAQNHVDTYGKAVDYAMYGGITLLAIVVLINILPTLRWYLSGYLIALGTLLFSGSLFIHTLLNVDWITAITPWGGTLLIIGWLSIAVVALLATKPR